MEWLNYHHLLYFWKTARLGSVAAAAEDLRLAPPTVSTQIKSLEASLGEPLFRRSGRKLTLTELGQTVFDYAEDIFALGSELMNVVQHRPTGKPLRLNVGISDVVAKMVVRQLLRPAMGLEQPIRLVCREGEVERLLGELAAYRLDVILSDRPAPETARVKTFDHLLGRCGLTFMGQPELVAELDGIFPKCLDGAPMMLPTHNSAVRHSLESWFAGHGIQPAVTAEFEDSALMMAFANEGLGLFPVPTVVEPIISSRYNSLRVGQTDDDTVRFYAITAERRLSHPAVAAITTAARESLF